MQDSHGAQLAIEQLLEQDQSKIPVLFPEGLDKDSLPVFLQYLSAATSTDKFIRLYAVFGEELFLFLSLFQSETVRVPSMSSLRRMKEACLIYTFLKQREFTESAYEKCSKLFNRRRHQVDSIVSRICKTLSKMEGAKWARRRT